MFNLFESPINVSVGNIESVRINKKGRVKYEISYLDGKGKEHKAWSNWMHHIKSMTFRCSHVFREGNVVADGFANLGLGSSLLWHVSPPPSVSLFLGMH